MKPLKEHGNKIKSEHGEDGILAELFRRIGIQHKWCVEFGALNGTHDSNTWNLIVNEGWSAVLIEADKTYFEKLRKTYREIPRAHCINEFVEYDGKHSLDAILSRTDIPQNFDLLSIDIDGGDYHVWNSLSQYRPRVVVIEFNPTIPNDIEFVQPRNPKIFQGSSLFSLVLLAKEKGYQLVEVNETNAFFVPGELFHLCGVEDNTLDTLRKDRSLETRLFQLYDGTLMLAGYDRLFWHKIPIDHEKLQVLPKEKRIYPARIPEAELIRILKYHVRKLPMYPFLMSVKKLFRL